VPLDDHLVRKEPDAAGFRFRVIKGISNVDGKAYALRRFNHRHCVPTPELTLSAREAVDRWSIFGRHPHVSALRGTFVSADMGEAPALFYAYDYHAGSLSLREYHCDNGEKKKVCERG
jgi:PAB-dependent poly(A)-specific ribonuclease subunit 3